MSFDQFIFYLLAGIAIISGLMMISVKNPVKAAMWLVLAFIATAGLWLIAQAEFLGLVLVLVYVGAVMVLFLFVVMMLDINIAVLKEGFTQYLALGVMASVAIFSLMYLVVGGERFDLEHYAAPAAVAADFSNTRALAIPLYTTHAYAFILAAVLLLVAIVAAITLTLRRRPNTEVLYQNIDKQVKTRAEDRMVMIKMESTVEPMVENKEQDK